MKNKSIRKRIGIGFIAAGFSAMVLAAGLHAYNTIEESSAAESSERTAQELLAKIVVNQEKENFTDTGTEPANQILAPDKSNVVLLAEQPLDLSQSISSDSASYEDDSRKIPAVKVDDELYIGVLSIPSLGLKLPVNSTWSYPKLKVSPCRYTGNAADNTLTIAAHNYKKHFGKISSLKAGDALSFTDAQGTSYSYTVAEIETIKPTNIGSIVISSYDLNLFTCNYDGSARVAIRCTRE